MANAPQPRSATSAVVAVALLAAGTVSSAPPQDRTDGVTTKFSMDYYDVTGDSWPELKEAIRRNLITVAGTSQKWEGVTHYEVTLQPKALVTGGLCTAENVSVEIDMTIKVPRLAAGNGLHGGDLECWAAYDRKLTEHEEWHARIALKTAGDLIDELRRAHGASCEDLQQISRSRFAQAQREQDLYDTVSQHGMQQWRAFGLAEMPDEDVSKGVIMRCSHQM